MPIAISILLGNLKMPRASFKRNTELGDMIKLERRQLNLTQREFSEEHGIPLGVLREIEQGKTSVSFRSVEKILNALGRKLQF
jgi:transcriptional regulator with XRE-family HTH domain